MLMPPPLKHIIRKLISHRTNSSYCPKELLKETTSFILQLSEELDLVRLIYFHLKLPDSEFNREPAQRLEASLKGWTSQLRSRVVKLWSNLRCFRLVFGSS